MSCNYSKKTIWDYINGFYVENIDKLENDYKFMMDVITITRDKNLYNLCSDEIKKNYEFIKFIINTFSEDKKFVKEIADQYLNKKSNEDSNYKELIFILCNIFENNKDDEKYLLYFLKRAAIVTCERVLITSIIEEETDINIKKLYGKGFILYQTSEFGRSNIMIDYIAKVFLEEIFYENDKLSIEELIHTKFNGVDKLEKYGIKNFIFSYVEKYDLFLTSYLSANMSLISGIEKDIIRIKNNWNNYNENILSRKKCIFEGEAFNLIEKYQPDYTYIEICRYIDSLNIIPNTLEDDDYEEEVLTITKSNMSLNDYICVREITKLAKELYLSPIIKTIYEDNICSESIDSIVNNSKKILKFIPNKQNNI